MKILKFYSPTCGPCKVVDNLLRQLNAEFTSINVAEDCYLPQISNIDITTYYQVQSVPTLIKIEDNGTEIKRLKGVPTIDNLKEFLYN